MRISIFGATGFIGYTFYRLLTSQSEFKAEPTVYCTGPQGLSNLSRHDVDIAFRPYPLLATQVPDSADYLVNFSHPFRKRDGLTVTQQVEILGAFITRSIENNPGLRVIHVSSMSVYEPFAKGEYFSEDVKLAPPGIDEYARTKLELENALTNISGAEDRILILRPTVVYGPYCRPWTDAIMAAFRAGDVEYRDLGGRIQPLWGADLAKLILQAIRGFRAGIVNVASDEVVEWCEFMEFMSRVVGRGQLVERKQGGGLPETDADRSNALGRLSGRLFSTVGNLPWAMQLARRIGPRLPAEATAYARRKLGGAYDPALGPYERPFFGEDRLVSTTRLAAMFPDCRFSRLADNVEELRHYYDYRFTDADLAAIQGSASLSMGAR